MASNKPQTKPDAPANPIKPVTPDVIPDDDGLAKYTWNVRGASESLTIRTNDVEELQRERDRWKAVISPPRRKLPYMHGGDACLVEGCGGAMVTRTGTNRKTQQPYQFLRCSNAPKCNFTAYIEDEQNTPEDAPISPAQARTLATNGAADVATTAAG